MLFRQNLEDGAYDWFSDLGSEVKNNWPAIRSLFLASFEITIKDAQTKKFELRMKLANLEQTDGENIADYLKRAMDLSRKLPNDEVDVGMATLKGMRDMHKRDQVTFECNKSADYSFKMVERLIILKRVKEWPSLFIVIPLLIASHHLQDAMVKGIEAWNMACLGWEEVELRSRAVAEAESNGHM